MNDENTSKREKSYRIAKKIFDFTYLLLRENYNLSSKYMNFACKLFSKNASVRYYKPIGLNQYCSENGLLKEVLEPSQNRIVCKPCYFGSSKQELHSFISPEIYYTSLKDVSIIGGNSFIISKDHCLYDMFTYDKDDRYDLRFGSLIGHSKSINEVAIMSIDKGLVYERGIFLLGFGSHNYYHFTIEIMSKFNYINSMDHYIDYPIFIDEIVYKVPQFKQILDDLNSRNFQIIPLEKNVQVNVNELVYFSDCAWMPINLKKNTSMELKDCLLSEGAITYVRDSVLHDKMHVENNKYSKNIFLARKTMANKRLVNEEDVSNILINYGFEVIYPENLSFREQVQVFGNAQVIIGTTGAALTNLIYANPGTKFACIIPEGYNFNIYSTIANFFKLKPVFLDAKIVKKGQTISTDQFELDLLILKNFLEQYIKEDK